MNNLLLIQPKPIFKRLYSKAIWNFSRSDKTIYLTFDDGPIPNVTEWVLSELQKFNAKATFFCIGNNILKNPEIFARIKHEGHLVANHTMSHIKGFKFPVADYVKEVDACEALTKTKYFRPPYGQIKRSQYKSLIDKGYKIVLWDVISYDYEKISSEKCVGNVIDNTRNGSVVLFHDSIKAEKNLRQALPALLKHFSDKGFEFKSIVDS